MKWIASMGGVGFIRPAPGTWGSALVLPAVLLGPAFCALLALVLLMAGLSALRRLPEAKQDPGWVVIDEGAGQALALAALPEFSWLGVLLAFALFRLFDITKPGPVGWADRVHGPVGVMADDIVAGIFAGVILLGVQWAGVSL
ncbi:phosphatidylglycerophosphatase A [Rhodovarius crocodyli]|uniref:Phosphatidylglycerophosphatase A n=1 Tax=Rhodovarius crocodyli TaxID=1979269 RepID=A0A437MIP5_9PROT|nr:phosphatidylglycerophosphatase A [Rhodovarius crocodyli]RVT97512.1 phosphatidylglycerophosphatase A [Rhodovarius crocodyli]